MVRTREPGPRGISCLLAPAGTPGLSAGHPERTMGLRASPVAQVRLDGATLGTDRLLGAEAQGFAIAMAALDGGRLGIAACAVGLAQAAFDTAVDYAAQRHQSGRPHTQHAAMAKLFCTDMAMRTTADAVQILGAAGYTEDYAVERYMREAKVLQIFEVTNQIQRLVIAKGVDRTA